MSNGIFVGLSTIDVIYSVKDFPSRNTKISAHKQEVYVGGPATNASITFSHLGGRSTLVTAIGRHALGEVIRRDLYEHSVQFIDLAPESNQIPAISSAAVNNQGERNVVSANGVLVEKIASGISEEILEGSAIVLVDGHYMQACLSWADAAHNRGLHVVLDGGSWKPGTGELLRCTDVAICSADFIPPGCSSQDEVLHYVSDCGVTHVAITNGAHPIRYRSGDVCGTLNVPLTQAVDTLGAGDIFHGAFCYFFSTRHGFLEALDEAAKIAADSCRYPGTRDWMKHR